ncbi:MAG TPA: L-threonylcarbamoyladenylate synthase [Anaerolineaceae bacterium]|jgi:L-threonylcarbamoyladenylate synthase|nr:L-threonylcarbamoyladenylate synthase [Anaerolineaceae bacterium]HPD62781.1 L-threonylcarbamoyladenylate synthase [Anaerolineaceae bacterium]HQK05712.1 L-threonylcarbamoyladenylate synthase [Anaerolineaceae bacterium]HRS74290.1 L-threonylcarbamoyladenylate synthase [Anaerolineaceae bacterium]
MQTITLPADNPASIETALDLLTEGEIVAFPTDTVYGLGANAFYSPGIIKLFEAKGRDANKAIAVLIGDNGHLDLLTDFLSANARKLIKHFWPGGLTIVVPKKKDLPELLSAGSSIGIRMPNHNIALELLNKFGPLATTSANLSGKNNPHNAGDVMNQLNGRVPLILDGGRCPGGVPSTVVDCSTDEVRILRPGAISHEAIDAVISRL